MNAETKRRIERLNKAREYVLHAKNKHEKDSQFLIDLIIISYYERFKFLITRFLPKEKNGLGGAYPYLQEKGKWYDMPLLADLNSTDLTGAVTKAQSLACIKKLLLDALEYDVEETLKSKKRHKMRFYGVMTMMAGSVPVQEQNSLGNWSDADKRNHSYAYVTIPREAALTLGGTAKMELGQHHRPKWTRVKPPDGLKKLLLEIADDWNKQISANPGKFCKASKGFQMVGLY